MGFSPRTTSILSALRDLAGEYSFEFAPEGHLFPQHGARSKRADAVFSLPSGRPVFWFEIDDRPDRAAHNRLKIFGDVLSALPTAAIAIHHGPAASRQPRYQKVLVDAGFVLPPSFLDDIDIPSESPETIAAKLRAWLDNLFDQLAFMPEWGTVFAVAEQYQPLIRNASLELAVAHLSAQAELAWFLVQRGRIEEERLGSLTVALARMLQRAGYHNQARHQIRQLRKRLSSQSSLRAETIDDAETISLLLRQPDFSSARSLAHLSGAVGKVHSPHHKSQFLWRQAITQIISGRPAQAEDLVKEYRDLLPHAQTIESNIALLDTLAALLLRRGDPREAAARYARHERWLLERKEGPPDGTVHGVVTALYLQVLADMAAGNKRAAAALFEIDGFCRSAGVPKTADGLREIRAVLDRPLLLAKPRFVDGRLRLAAQAGRKRKEALNLLCARVDFACQL